MTSYQVQFGSDDNKWSISPRCFTFQELQDGSCLGSFFELPASPGTTTPPIIMGDTFLMSCFCFWDLCPSVAIVLSADRNYAYVNRKTFTLSSVPTRLRWASWPSRLLQSIRTAQPFPLPRSHNPLSSLTGINPSSTGVSVRRASSDAPSSLMRICPFRQCFFHIFLL